MCQPKPGPRCSSHARQKLLKAYQDLQELENAAGREASTKSETAINLIKVDVYRKHVAEALKEYQTTPEGITKLQEKLETLDPNSYEAKILANEIAENKQTRESQKHNLVLLRQGAQNNLEGKDIIESQDEVLRKCSEEIKTLASEREEIAVVHRANQTVAKNIDNAIIDDYAAQNKRYMGDTPGLWVFDHQDSEGNYTPIYKEKLEADRKVAVSQKALTENSAAIQGASMILNLETERARIIEAKVNSGIPFQDASLSNPNIGYGSYYSDKQGNTNVRLRTTIPETNMGIYAKVTKIEGESITLETGEVLQKSDIQPGHFYYESPTPELQLQEDSLYSRKASGTKSLR